MHTELHLKQRDANISCTASTREVCRCMSSLLEMGQAKDDSISQNVHLPSSTMSSAAQPVPSGTRRINIHLCAQNVLRRHASKGDYINLNVCKIIRREKSVELQLLMEVVG